MIISYILFGLGFALLVFGEFVAGMIVLLVGTSLFLLAALRSSNRGKLNELQSSTKDLPHGRCPNCNINVSKQAVTCPSCGFVFKRK